MSALGENKRWLAGIEYNPDVIMSQLVTTNVYHYSYINKPVLLLMIWSNKSEMIYLDAMAYQQTLHCEFLHEFRLVLDIR